MTTTPDQIRDDIERTRADLSHDVNQLADTVDPRQIAQRQADKVKGAVAGVKDRVMGSDSDDGALGAAVRGPRRAADWAGERTAANPWAAGVIALGAGWLVGSMLPATRVERDAARGLSQKAGPVIGESVGAAAGEVAEHLRGPVGEAAEAVKGAASEAAGAVKETAADRTTGPSGASSF